MINKKRVIITSLKYSAGATLGGVIANAYIAPRMELPGANGMSWAEILSLVLFAFPMCFAFFVLVFSIASRIENRDTQE